MASEKQQKTAERRKRKAARRAALIKKLNARRLGEKAPKK